MKYLADHYNCDSPYELGIRIHSVALPISVREITCNTKVKISYPGRGNV